MVLGDRSCSIGIQESVVCPIYLQNADTLCEYLVCTL